VISDNASDEDYGSYVDALADPRVVYYRQPRPVPVSENWQQALSLATGDYVLMLGDDDALAPRFSDIVIPHLESDRPDLAYLAAYHYCYPGVVPDAPAGYFAAVISEFLRGDPEAFCLTRPYARELAASVLDFRHRFNYNAQHFVLKREFLQTFAPTGGIYQSPYPDFFAAVLIFFRARSILVLPRNSVVIGISPKSFGAYYFSSRQKEGYRFLDNEAIDPALREFVTQASRPGDMNNTNWLIAAETARRALPPGSLPEVNLQRYAAIQLNSLLRERYVRGIPLDAEIADMRRRLPVLGRIRFGFFQSMLSLMQRRSRDFVEHMIRAAEREVGQYPDDSYRLVDIGVHKSIADALAWLQRTGRERVSADGRQAATQESFKAEFLRYGGMLVRAIFPGNADQIIAVLQRGPVGVLQAAGRRIRLLAGMPAAPLPVRQLGAPPDPSLLRIVVTRGSARTVLAVEEFDDFEFHNGDQLAITPPDLAARLLRTPEGDAHIRAADGSGIRVPATMELADFMGFQVPAHLARLTGAGIETFAELGKAHVANYKKYVGLEPGMSFLEIGSGIGRDAFQLIGELGPAGRYVGIDVQRESIVWCQKNIGRAHPNFRFVHVDAAHELHNPYGAKTTMDFPLPAPDRSIDRVAMQSVLTHIFEEEVVHYLREIARVLKVDGLAYATFLLYSEEIVTASRKNRLTRYGLRFEHKYADGCYVDNPQYPTGGVAYTAQAMQRMIGRAGLRLVRPFLKGQWSGYHADPDDDGQDVAILAPAEGGKIAA
jgi:SAM-dependent methyltransferase